MNPIRWDEVKAWFDPTENGTSPDVVVPRTTMADWDALLALVRSEGWRWEYWWGDEPRALPSSPVDLFVRVPGGATRSLWLWTEAGPEWIVRPWTPDEIVGDVDLHEIQGQEALEAFCRFLRTLGTALGKEVHLMPEGSQDLSILVYDSASDEVRFVAGPWR